MSANTYNETYFTERGNAYQFAYEKVGGSWRVYVDGQPSYGYRATDSYSTHRYGLTTRPYICWTQPLERRKDAEVVAHLWANGTDTYIATGSFPKPATRGWFTRVFDWLDI